jgi:FkbM family methyltransferase
MSAQASANDIGIDRCLLGEGLLFRKPSLEITGRPTASVILRPIIRCTAALSSITRHRGFGRFLGGLSQLPYFGETYCTAALARDSFFGFGATDSYWGFYVYTGQLYERPLHYVFAAIWDVDYQLLDCGANYGYWSVVLSGLAYGKRNVVAVEASLRTFKVLESNCALNGERFTCINRAVSDRTGRSLLLENRKHVTAHICAELSSFGDQYFEKVESVSLDDLCGMLRPNPERLVVKLDIEGHETEAMMAAQCIRDRDVLIMFEDHTFDPSCRNTAYLLGLGGFLLFWVDDSGWSVPIRDVSELKRIKGKRNYGNNCFAVTRDGEFHRCLREKLRGEALR